MSKQNFARVCASVLLLCATTSCMSIESGQDFDMSRAQSFQEGKTTRTDIISALGPPTSTGRDAEGAYISYMYMKSNSGGLKNIAAAYGIGSMRMKSANKICAYRFDDRDKLKSIQCSEGTQ